MAEDAFVTDFEHIMADDITDDVRFIMYDSASGKTASAGEVSKYMMKNVHVDTTLTEEGSAAEAKAVGEALATKADTKGRYGDLIVGGAEQLMADEYETDKDPYLFRPTGGSADVGNREYVDKIVGGTVAWNQLVQNGDFASADRWATNTGTSLSVASGIASFTPTAPLGFLSPAGVSAVTGHKYITLADINISSGRVKMNCSYANGYTTKTGVFETVGCIWVSQYTGGGLSYPRFYDQRTSDWDAVKVKNVHVHDLTRMFGSTIADYIYSLEQATAGAGVAWFKKLFPKPYYEYNAGELMSVQAASHDMVGFNQWDEETIVGYYDPLTGTFVSESSQLCTKNMIPCEPNTTYYMRNGSGSYQCNVIYYDASGNYLTGQTQARPYFNATFTTPSGAYFFNVNLKNTYGTTYKNDICINISKTTGSPKNGDYVPYEKHTYALDSDLVLRGIPKLDSSNKLYYDGDTYASDGGVTRKYGVVDLGTLTWIYDGDEIFRAHDTRMKFMGNGICTKYKWVQVLSRSQVGDGEISVTNSEVSPILRVHDSTAGTDAAAFKAAMSGVYLVYELATPTTETADGYEQYQICDPSGTEQFVTDSIVPVGHETRYPHDLKKKVETAPDSPSTDGTYLMKRSGGKNTYMALPSTPSSNGAYVLTVTVSGGTASYSWTAKG